MKTVLITIVLCASIIYSHPLAAQPDLMNSGISKNLQSWLQKIPPGQENLYGFNNRDEFSFSELGNPYAVYTLSSDFFNQIESENFLEPTGEWRVPVVVNNQYRALLTVIRENGNWKIVDLGASLLARELQKINQAQKSGNDDLKILRVFQLQSDFLLLDDAALPASEIHVIPLHSAYLNLEELNSDKRETYKLSDMLSIIREALSEKKANF